MRFIHPLLLLALGTEAYGSIALTQTSGESISIGLGLRTEITSSRNSAEIQSEEQSNAFEAGFDARIYFSAALTDTIKVTLNTGYSEGDIKLLDAITRFEPSEAFNVWLGRFLPPSDRSNFSGPYYLNAWVFPGLVQRYPAIFAGRDNGAAVWGDTFNQILKYQVGVFEGMGRDPISTREVTYRPANDRASPLMAGRVTLNFLDKEPGYYNSSTWYGTKQILAIGAAYQYQKDSVGYGNGVDATGLVILPGIKGDFEASSVDFIYEQPLPGSSAWTLEGAYYEYDSDNLDALRQGDGFMVLTSYLFAPMQGALGRYQPLARFQSYNDTISDSSVDRTDLQINYIMKGHNARISMIAAKEQTIEGGIRQDLETITLGTQLQF